MAWSPSASRTRLSLLCLLALASLAPSTPLPGAATNGLPGSSVGVLAQAGGGQDGEWVVRRALKDAKKSSGKDKDKSKRESRGKKDSSKSPSQKKEKKEKSPKKPSKSPKPSSKESSPKSSTKCSSSDEKKGKCTRPAPKPKPCSSKDAKKGKCVQSPPPPKPCKTSDFKKGKCSYPPPPDPSPSPPPPVDEGTVTYPPSENNQDEGGQFQDPSEPGDVGGAGNEVDGGVGTDAEYPWPTYDQPGDPSESLTAEGDSADNADAGAGPEETGSGGDLGNGGTDAENPWPTYDQPGDPSESLPAERDSADNADAGAGTEETGSGGDLGNGGAMPDEGSNWDDWYEAPSGDSSGASDVGSFF